MQVILMDKVLKLGNLGDIVKVKDGYARNYLIPNGFAKRATAENKKLFEAQRAELERLTAEKLAAAQAKAAKLDGVRIELTRKASVDGRLFGSVSAVDIVAALASQGIEIEKADVRMPDGVIKAAGEYSYEVALHADVVSSITVVVVGEQ